MNLKVQNTKFFLIGMVTIAMALIFAPFAAMHVLTTFNWWQILAAYALFTIPAMIGIAILFRIWNSFEMKTTKREAPKQ